MAATVTSISPRRVSVTPPGPASGGRRPFRDNPRLILAGIAVLVGVLVGILLVANRSRFSPDFTSEFVLYALTAADLTMLVALVFVLARNIVKLVVERRGGLPFGMYAEVVEPGRVRIGDPVEPVSSRPSETTTVAGR